MIKISDVIYFNEAKFKNLSFIVKKTDPDSGYVSVVGFGNLNNAIEYKLHWEHLGSIVQVFHLQEFNELGAVEEVK